MNRAISLLLLLVSALAYADLSGKYEATAEGRKYTLTIKQAGKDLSGDINDGEQSLALTGTVEGDALTGTLKVPSVNIDLFFKGSKTAKGIKMKIAPPNDAGKADWNEADEYEFVLVAVANPEPKAKESVLSKFSKQPSSVLKDGKEYVHASGGRFRYPSNWTLKEVDGGLQLIPPDAVADEAYFVLADSANGQTDPASKAVISIVDQQVTQLLPFVKRVGEVEKTVAGVGPGAILIWEGKAPNDKEIRVKGFLTIMKGFGVSLVAVGAKAPLDKRDAALRQIFATFGWGQGKLDQQLIGNWKHWSYSGTNGYGRETSARVTLGGDGAFTYQSDTETSISAQGTNSLGEVQWTGGMAGRRGNGWKGTWNADGKTLILHFEDGSTETFTYSWKQEGANVFLIVQEVGGSKPTEWSRAG